MMQPFDFAFEYLIKNEGGFTNNPDDHGGATNFGITQEDLSIWAGQPASVEDVKKLSLETAKDIYHFNYWEPLGADRINSPRLATALFDIGVVRGLIPPVRYAQRICNDHGAYLNIDGHLGPLTLEKLNTLDPGAFICQFEAMVEDGFRQIVAENPSQSVFATGWSRRAKRLLTLV